MTKDIQAYLYQNIPLSKAMGVQVEKAHNDQVILSAPFAPNINHKKTVFGGSLHAVATLACWTLLYVNLREVYQTAQIVIARSEISYLAPIDADFKVECLLPEQSSWQRFLKTLQAKSKARIDLEAHITHKDKLCVDYRATFAALIAK